MTAPSHLAVRLVSAGTLVIVVLLLAGLGAAPYLRLMWLDNGIAESRRNLDGLGKQMNSKAALKKENGELTLLGRDASILLKGETVGIAGANLQKLISNIVTEYGAGASSFQILPAADDGNLMRISLNLSINVGIDGLRDILHRFETGTPLVFINSISARAPDNLKEPDPDYIGPLSVTLEVSSFAVKNGSL